MLSDGFIGYDDLISAVTESPNLKCCRLGFLNWRWTTSKVYENILKSETLCMVLDILGERYSTCVKQASVLSNIMPALKV